MYTKKALIGLLAMGVCMTASAKEAEFKCHVAFADGTEKIVFAEGANMGQAKARLRETPGHTRYDRRTVPVKIVECQNLADAFRDAQTRALDDATPR